MTRATRTIETKKDGKRLCCGGGGMDEPGLEEGANGIKINSFDDKARCDFENRICLERHSYQNVANTKLIPVTTRHTACFLRCRGITADLLAVGL